MRTAKLSMGVFSICKNNFFERAKRNVWHIFVFVKNYFDIMRLSQCAKFTGISKAVDWANFFALDSQRTLSVVHEI